MVKGIYSYYEHDDAAIEWFIEYSGIAVVAHTLKRVLIFPDVIEDNSLDTIAVLSVLLSCPEEHIFAMRRLVSWLYHHIWLVEVDHE